MTQAGLEITMYPRLISNFEQFSCLNLLYMEIHLSVTMPSTIEFQCITLPFICSYYWGFTACINIIMLFWRSQDLVHAKQALHDLITPKLCKQLLNTVSWKYVCCTLVFIYNPNFVTFCCCLLWFWGWNTTQVFVLTYPWLYNLGFAFFNDLHGGHMCHNAWGG